jgi:RimJ/RimL family protein N-acetyltransferase
VRTPRLTLRYPDDADAITLAELAARGVHPPDFMPFGVEWTDVAPPLQQRNTLQYLWRTRAMWTPDDWDLAMAVVVDGEIVGVQGLLAQHFAVLRAPMTGSWLGRSYQGKGIGTEMRAAMVHLAFAGLGAQFVHSAAFTDNAASLAVSRRIGYEENGRRRVVRRGEAAGQIALVLRRERWEQSRRDDVVISGLDACLELFGAR